jgi:biopolymer transport protein ExbD
MKASVKANRHQRHYRRMHKTGGLNLVSLMDIFTILVFFLMVNSSDVQILQQNNSVKLPSSIANKKPSETLVVTITSTSILVQGRSVALLKGINQNSDLIPGLKKELDYQYHRMATAITKGKTVSLPITIMGDKSIPYETLKKIMSTCVAAHYSNISLAVNHKVGKEA